MIYQKFICNCELSNQVFLNNNNNVIMKQHFLKTVNPYFEAVYYSKKRFEYRLNDRDYQVGDEVILQEYDSINNSYSGRVVHVRITFLLCAYTGLSNGYVVFSFDIIDTFQSVIYTLSEEQNK